MTIGLEELKKQPFHQFLVRFIIWMHNHTLPVLEEEPMKPYRRVWKILSLLSIVTLTSLMIHTPLIRQVDASQGTWVIDNQTVIIENDVLLHEGDIIIRGTGRLSLSNSSLTIIQLMSWQFQIYIEDSGVFVIDDSDLRSKYPFRIECESNTEVNMSFSSSSNALIGLNDNSRSYCTDTSLFGISTNEWAQITLVSCNVRSAVSNDRSTILFDNSDLGSIWVNDNSQTNISDSQSGPVVVESTETTFLKDSTADALRGWGESKIDVSGCTLGDYRYSDYVEASISNSSIGDLDATGASPLTLNQIVIGSAILRGSSDVTMNECSVESIEVYLYSTITLWNSTCGDFFATEYADVKILGESTATSNLGDCIISQMSTAIITWSNFDYLEIGHSSTAQVNDSYAGYFSTWRYTSCKIDIWRCEFYEFRVSGSEVSMHDTSVEIWSNIGSGSNLSAISCYFGLDLTFYDTSIGHLENCTMNRLRPQYESQVVIRNCTALVVLLDYANRIRTVDSVPAGDISYWTSELSFPDVQWNLTVYDSKLIGWDIAFRFEEDYSVVNSTLNRVTVSAVCSVAIWNSTLNQLVVSNGDTEVVRSELTTVEVQQSAHLVLNESFCDEVRNHHSSTSEYYNSTFDRFYSYFSAECHLFDCVIRSIGPSGTSHVHLENCTMTNFDSFQYAISEVVNSTVTDRLAVHDFTITSIANSTIALLNGYHSSQIAVSSCTVNDIRILQSSEVIMSDSVLVYIRCIGTSSLSISGNLSDTISCVIENSAQVIRELMFVVEDHLDNPIQSATVEIYDPLGSPVVSGLTNSQGICYLTLVFDLGWFGFLSSFTVMASFGESNTTIGFTTTTLQPITMIIDLSGTYFASELELPKDSGFQDTRENEMVSQSIVGPKLFEIIIFTMSLISLSVFITHEYRGHSIIRSKIAKLQIAIRSHLQKLYTTDFQDYRSQQEVVKK
jgi:hypothetical protein